MLCTLYLTRRDLMICVGDMSKLHSLLTYYESLISYKGNLKEIMY